MNISFTISSAPPQVVRAACTTRDDIHIDGMVGEKTDEETLLAVLLVALLLRRRQRQRQELEPPFLRCDDLEEEEEEEEEEEVSTRGGAAPGRKRASRVSGNKRKARDAAVEDPATGDAFATPPGARFVGARLPQHLVIK